MNKSLQPAIIGGVVLGLLSAIPFVNMVNICCCGWAILGGLLAGHLYIKRSQTPVTMGEGAKVGAIAGVIGGIIYVIIGLPLGLIAGTAMSGMIASIFERVANPEQAELMRRQMEMQQDMSIAARLGAAIPFTLLGFVLLIGFATIGGILAVQFFEKRKGMTAPPPPPAYGGPPPQGGYGG